MKCIFYQTMTGSLAAVGTWRGHFEPSAATGNHRARAYPGMFVKYAQSPAPVKGRCTAYVIDNATGMGEGVAGFACTL